MIRSSVGLVSALLLLLGSCAHHVLATEEPEPGTEWKEANSVALGFGGAQKRTVTAECPTGLIDAMRLRQSFFDSLITVVTLGLVAPARVGYACRKLDTPEGSTKPTETTNTTGE